MPKLMFAKMTKTNGEPYTRRLVRTVRGQALGNLPSQDDKALRAEPTIYNYLGYTKPFKRLWISSLTDEAIQTGLANLKDGSEYDSLYLAADCRAKADWLVGINASRALAISSGMGNNSLGRVQTPTLAMICARFRENRNFVPVKYWQLHITLEKEGSFRQFRYTEELKKKVDAENLYSVLKLFQYAKVTKVERKKVCQAQPLLYDLATLQKDGNIHLGLSAETTLEIAQSLYEKKLVSYPRTGSRYIPGDVFREIPALLQKVLCMDKFKHFPGQMDPLKPARKSVDDKKITDHHALIITGNNPSELSFQELKIYHMIAGRMLEAFGPKCEKENLLMEVSCDGLLFRSRSQEILSPGWRNVFNHSGDREEDEIETDESNAEFVVGENPKISGYSMVQKKTMPQPLYTEATLLAAMETGKNSKKEAPGETLENRGLGTPATRAAIISTLFKREYIKMAGKALVPTEKGLTIYNAVRGMRIADAEMTGNWEKMLSGIEEREIPPDTFMNAVKTYTGQVAEEILSFEFPQSPADSITCPKCKNGKITVRSKLAKCSNEQCGLVIFRSFLNKELSDRNIQQLLSSGSTGLIKGFRGKKDTPFDAALVFDNNYNLTFSFPEANGKGDAKAGKKPPQENYRDKNG
jgi:DNA topoisomerase-3